jgi:hypothetical protein
VSPTGRQRAAPLLLVAGVLAFARVAWDVPEGVLLQGALVGGLTSLLALGLALVWRANRAINFASGDLGAVPATLAVLLAISTAGFGWWPAFVVGLVAALLLGFLVERLIVRRFQHWREPAYVDPVLYLSGDWPTRDFGLYDDASSIVIIDELPPDARPPGYPSPAGS